MVCFLFYKIELTIIAFFIIYCDVSPESRDIGARIYGAAKHVSPNNEQQQLGTLGDNEGIGTVIEGVP
jgi:hypothetical protein